MVEHGRYDITKAYPAGSCHRIREFRERCADLGWILYRCNYEAIRAGQRFQYAMKSVLGVGVFNADGTLAFAYGCHYQLLPPLGSMWK